MATYKLKRVTDSGVEDVSISVSMVDGAVDKTSEQEISGYKKFANDNGIATNRIHNLNGNAVYDFDGTNVRLGQTTLPLQLRGENTRPEYTTNGTIFNELALTSDIPTDHIKVLSWHITEGIWLENMEGMYQAEYNSSIGTFYTAQVFDSNGMNVGVGIKIASDGTLVITSTKKLVLDVSIMYKPA